MLMILNFVPSVASQGRAPLADAPHRQPLRTVPRSPDISVAPKRVFDVCHGRNRQPVASVPLHLGKRSKN